MELNITKDIQSLINLGGADTFKKALNSLINEWKEKEQVDLEDCGKIIDAMEAFAKGKSVILPKDKNHLYKFYFWLINNDEKLTEPTNEIYWRFSRYL